MNIYEKLTALQNKLKAPKSQYNKFGKYNYRNCEDIMEAAKPLLAENGLALIISDTIDDIGTRHYITATATLVNSEKPEEIITATALAREPESQKGMAESQITGTASSYARKYCLNGLFAIDDTKDADSMDNTAKTALHCVNKKQAAEISGLMGSAGVDPAHFLNYLGFATVESITVSEYPRAINDLKNIIKQNGGAS